MNFMFWLMWTEEEKQACCIIAATPQTAEPEEPEGWERGVSLTMTFVLKIKPQLPEDTGQMLHTWWLFKLDLFTVKGTKKQQPAWG